MMNNASTTNQQCISKMDQRWTMWQYGIILCLSITIMVNDASGMNQQYISMMDQ